MLNQVTVNAVCKWDHFFFFLDQNTSPPNERIPAQYASTDKNKKSHYNTENFVDRWGPAKKRKLPSSGISEYLGRSVGRIF